MRSTSHIHWSILKEITFTVALVPVYGPHCLATVVYSTLAYEKHVKITTSVWCSAVPVKLHHYCEEDACKFSEAVIILNDQSSHMQINVGILSSDLLGNNKPHMWTGKKWWCASDATRGSSTSSTLWICVSPCIWISCEGLAGEIREFYMSHTYTRHGASPSAMSR